jgi:Mn2+/Fe2+ NRAMP family transporter
MFRSLFHDHLQGSSFVLSAFTTFQLPASLFVFFGYVAVGHLFVCVSGVAVCGLSGRETMHGHINDKKENSSELIAYVFTLPFCTFSFIKILLDNLSKQL